MGRSPCCDEVGVKKGPWTPDEDKKLEDFIQKNGHGSWRALPKLAGLNRCGKSCRLRWTNYLRPDIKRGPFSEKEEDEIIQLHSVLGNKWSAIAMRLPGRTDNEIKNYWNTHLRKKLLQMGIDPVTHRPRADLALLASIPNLLAAVNTGNLPASIAALDNALRLQTDAAQMAKVQLFQSLVQVLSSSSSGATSSMSAINSYMNSNLLGNYQLPNDLSSFTNQLQLGLGHESKPIGLIDQVPNQTLPSSGFTNLSFDGVLPNHQIQHPNKPYNGKLDVFSQFDGSYASQLNVNSGYSQMSSPLTNPNSDSTHSFMSNSSENFAVDHMKPSSSSSAATYNMQLGGVNMEELNGEFYWNDVLDQNSLHNWSETL